MTGSPLLRIGELSKRTGVSTELLRAWVRPAAVLACLPGEHQDLGLIAFGLALRARSWRIVHLGPDAPVDTIEDACRRLEPNLVVLSAVTRERVRPVVEQLRALAAHRRLALAGAGAASSLPKSDGVILLTGDPIAEATRVTALARNDATGGGGTA